MSASLQEIHERNCNKPDFTNHPRHCPHRPNNPHYAHTPHSYTIYHTPHIRHHAPQTPNTTPLHRRSPPPMPHLEHVRVIVVPRVAVIHRRHAIILVQIVHDTPPCGLDVVRRPPYVCRHVPRRHPCAARVGVATRRHGHQHRPPRALDAFVKGLSEPYP